VRTIGPVDGLELMLGLLLVSMVIVGRGVGLPVFIVFVGCRVGLPDKLFNVGPTT
jgi:hypothetical protein